MVYKSKLGEDNIITPVKITGEYIMQNETNLQQAHLSSILLIYTLKTYVRVSHFY